MERGWPEKEMKKLDICQVCHSRGASWTCRECLQPLCKKCTEYDGYNEPLCNDCFNS